MNYYSLSDIVKLVLLFLVVALLVYGSRQYRLYAEGAIEAEDSTEVLIYETSELDFLIDELNEKNIQFSKEGLEWASETLGWRRFQSGRYELEGEYTFYDLFSKLGRGIQDPTRVTIIPGTDIGRLSRSLSLQLRPDSSEFAALFSDSAEVAVEHNLTGETLFARMLPDSYDMYWTTSAENAVERLLGEFERRVAIGLSEEIDRHELTLDEVVTLASIVEWEARDNAEKPKISGLYQNRLERGMLLQADPTVLYALGERRRLLFADYQFEHPYNTYLNRGLPPGPITNPDLSSIRAVLNPEEHDYLYMVATPEGTHQFSRTFQEHRQASEKWRRWIREQYRIKREREQEASDNS